MKRRVFLLSVLMTLGFVTFLSSCKKDRDDDRDVQYMTNGYIMDIGSLTVTSSLLV